MTKVPMADLPIREPDQIRQGWASRRRSSMQVSDDFQPIPGCVLGEAWTTPKPASVKDSPTIPGELFAKFQTGFYADPVDAVFKALGVQ